MLKDCILDLQEELRWDKLFESTQGDLRDIAEQIKKQIANGEPQPMDFEQL